VRTVELVGDAPRRTPLARRLGRLGQGAVAATLARPL